MCSAFRFCLSVYLPLSPRGMTASSVCGRVGATGDSSQSRCRPPPGGPPVLPPKNWSRWYESPEGREDHAMKKKQYTPEQIVRLLRDVEAGQAQGRSVEEMCRQLGIADSSYHRWKSQYGGMRTDEVRRLKELERENDRLKQIVAELTPDKKVLQEAARGN